ncbi:respiratory nitrate reductase subunit gamma [Candidatus Magnetominusculus xianensis]|uniref:Nitrate reductase gamma subunit n=1 Tax=Candidatus Magnetominusculus xianensis TaxID=1748249 RepID=A0ABR5SG20_9BACT|nr:respiratory nitrate reductase subunit gamma [Candidatus Magnetominusculus xianensis]KWT87228.1 nitrate reductase gamma subunit [Candidatus Magnetominusculus xianensis]MBF0405073.1 respiratory nitrate reductase subunit gamma [Nitrospirota bacterium]
MNGIMNGVKFMIDMYVSGIVYTAVLVFVAGFLCKMYFGYYKTPQPLKIPQTPQPTTLSGVMMRMAGDIFFFRSLAKGTTLLFIASWVFHFTFLLMLIRHLRYFVNPVPECLTVIGNGALGISSLLMMALIVLLIRRILDRKVSYVTSFADYFVLLLIMGIVQTGIMMHYEQFRPNIVEVKAFMLSLMEFKTPFLTMIMHPHHAPGNSLFITHISLVAMLLIYFPFSKLMHAGGYFFSPTRNMVNNAREVRYINPWDKG